MKRKYFFQALAAAALIAAGCETPQDTMFRIKTDDIPGDDGSPNIVEGGDLEELFSSAKDAFADGKSAIVITLTNSITVNKPVDTADFGGGTIVLEAKDGAETIITYTETGALFDLKNGLCLTLGKGITVQGDGRNGKPLVIVGAGSTLTVAEGAKITGGHAYQGGAVYVADGGTLVVAGGELSGNSADYQGGAVYAEAGGIIIITGGTFDKNSITGAADKDTLGGAIYGGNIRAMNAEFSGNSVKAHGEEVEGVTAAGGAIACCTAAADGSLLPDGTVILNGVTFSGNTATATTAKFSGRAYGGAVYAAAVTASGGEFSGNSVESKVTGSEFITSADAKGGAIYSSGVNLTGTTVSGNTASAGTPNGGASLEGGGIYSASVTLNGVTVSGNTITVTAVTPQIDLISGQTVSGFGGGVYASSGGVVNNSTIKENTITIDLSGAVRTNDINNYTARADGAGIYAGSLTTTSSLTVKNSIVTGNTATAKASGEKHSDDYDESWARGGGILSATLTLNGVTITGNKAIAIGADESTGSKAKTEGGGIMAGTLSTTGKTSITGNTAESKTETSGAETGNSKGGGVNVSASITLTGDTTITGNTRTGLFGAGSADIYRDYRTGSSNNIQGKVTIGEIYLYNSGAYHQYLWISGGLSGDSRIGIYPEYYAGFPSYSYVVSGSESWLAEHPEVFYPTRQTYTGSLNNEAGFLYPD